MKRILAAAAAMLVLACCAPKVQTQPQVVIFDTDMGNDIDDALALQMLFNYDKAGLIDLKAVSISKCNPHAIEFVDGVCRFNGYEDMPLAYCYNGPNPEDNTYLLPTIAAQYDGKPLIQPARNIDSGLEEGYVALRRWLSAEKDHSVTLIATGPLTNIGRLLDSEPDDISSLNGVDLVASKVKSLHIMSGNYAHPEWAEWNVLQDIEASRTVYEKCPVPLITSGWEVGGAVHYPHESILNDFGDPLANPVTVAYMSYQPMPYDRECWDLTSVFDAIDPDRSVFVRSEPGRITVTDDGRTLYEANPAGNHYYLSVPDPDKAVAALVNRCTGKEYSGQGQSLFSPGFRNRVDVSYVDGTLTYTVARDGRTLYTSAPISMTVDGASWAAGDPILGVSRSFIDETVTFPVPRKYHEARNRCNVMTLDFGAYELQFRAYDSGVAYRFVGKSEGEAAVNEKGGYRFNTDCPSYTLLVDNQQNWFEENYTEAKVGDLPKDRISMIPVLVKTDGVNVLLAEADIYSYAQAYLRPTGDGFDAEYPLYPSKEELIEWNNKRYATERFDYIVKTSLNRTFPWRVAGTFDSDIDIFNDELIYLLSEKTEDDFSWVKPGKVLWDWWNGRNITGVNFVSGINTDTYMYLVSYAAKHNWEYVLLDEGWSLHDDMLTLNPDTDVPAVCRFAEQMGVGVCLWAKWVNLDRQMDEAFPLMASWGVKGVKIDFMDRNDAEMVDFYERVAKKAVEYKMLVDFHGAYPNEGMRAKYPNLMTREGVVGLEYNKMKADMDTPHHELIIPFIRQWAGPMDFTPGSMLNSQPEFHRVIHQEPMSLGTRCHQMAMYVVYESPLQMVSDSPDKYDASPAWFPFLENVPAVWDETFPLFGTIGENIAIARRSGDTYYLGVMAAGEACDFNIPLSFLPDGRWTATIYRDGPNADVNAKDFISSQGIVNRGATIPVHLAMNGGYVLVIEPKK